MSCHIILMEVINKFTNINIHFDCVQILHAPRGLSIEYTA